MSFFRLRKFTKFFQDRIAKFRIKQKIYKFFMFLLTVTSFCYMLLFIVTTSEEL